MKLKRTITTFLTLGLAAISAAAFAFSPFATQLVSSTGLPGT